MNRARPGSNASRRGAAGRGDPVRTLRNVPPPSARRGVNTQKTDKARQDRTRARRSGMARRVWVVVRTLILAVPGYGRSGRGRLRGLALRSRATGSWRCARWT